MIIIKDKKNKNLKVYKYNLNCVYRKIYADRYMITRSKTNHNCYDVFFFDGNECVLCDYESYKPSVFLVGSVDY